MDVYIQDRVRLIDREIHSQRCLQLFMSDTYGNGWGFSHMLENATVLPVQSCFGMPLHDHRKNEDEIML